MSVSVSVVREASAGPRLLIVGCSTRAAAWSALRAGWRPVCADQFGDLDLQQIAEVLPVVNYPHGLPDAVRDVQAAAWMYVGALENHPQVVAELTARSSQLGPLLGTPADDLARLRDPVRLQEIASRHGWRALPTVVDGALRSPGEWLLKPFRSGGGIGIRNWSAGDAATGPLPTDCYWQQRVTGTSASAVLLVHHDGVCLVGCSEQLSGLSDAGCVEPFGYHGNLGPLDVDLALWQRLEQTVAEVVAGTRMRGLLGIDLILTATEPAVIEINPRYTASCEVWEHLTGVALLELHDQACRGAPVSISRDVLAERHRTPPHRCVGKQILYARQPCLVPDEALTGPVEAWQLPDVSDLPAPGSAIAAGQPICTVWAAGKTLDVVRARLRERVANWRKRFVSHSSTCR